MAEDKVYTPEIIEDTPFPGEVGVSVPTPTPPVGTYIPSVVKEKGLPTRKIAAELMGSALNTKSRKILKEFDFAPSGAIRVGDYKSGVSGDVRISPDGIVARNSAGLETIAIDGDTGDAVFRGTLQTGAVVSGLIDVGDNSIIIDGESKRIIFYDDNGVPVIVIGNA